MVEAANGLDGVSLLRRGEIDLALIDVMLPELDGLELVRRIRRDSTVPIILLTARGEETSRVAGLEVGADDYVVIPFSAPEVLARVRAPLRRARGLRRRRRCCRRARSSLTGSPDAAGWTGARSSSRAGRLICWRRCCAAWGGSTREQLLELVWARRSSRPSP